MLEAERALAVGLLDQAERHYTQVAASDPKNAIAVVGLARVALERGDQRGAYTFAGRALALDPDNPAANHLFRRMAEQMQIRGEALPEDARGGRAERPPARPDSRPARPRAPTDTPTATGPEPAKGLVGRLLRRRR